jgi:prephenate dehydratase
MFYADIALSKGQDSILIEKAVHELKTVSEKVRLLGAYYEIN